MSFLPFACAHARKLSSLLSGYICCVFYPREYSTIVFLKQTSSNHFSLKSACFRPLRPRPSSDPRLQHAYLPHHQAKSSSRPTLKSRQVAAKLIAHSTGSRVIALKSHTVWYGARPTDRTTRGSITVYRSLVSSLGFSVEAPLLCTALSPTEYSTLPIRPYRQSHVDLQQLNCCTALLQSSYGCPPIEYTPGPAC